MSAHFTILHTNDLHNRLQPDQAARLKALRSSFGASGLLLDAGDAISAGNVTYHPGGEPILDTMSDAGFDAMVVGNREFHVSQAGFCAKLNRARYPVLCANVRPRAADAQMPVVTHTVFTSPEGRRIGVFGVTVPMVTERMAVRLLSAYVFDDPVPVAAAMAEQLRPECDLLVCLSHAGVPTDERIAQAAPAIDLIVGGHTHTLLPHGQRVGDTLIVQTGCHAKLLGVVRAEWTEGRARLVANVQEL